MRLVEIDDAAPDGAPLELHPRLTVLWGAPEGVRQRLAEAFGSLTSGGEPGVGGAVEIHGVRMALDRSSLDLLGIDDPVDPVLHLNGSPQASRWTELRRHRAPASHPSTRPIPTTAVPSTAVPGGAVPGGAVPGGGADPAQHSREAARRRWEELRSELRSVTGERTVLGRRMDEVRTGLDSFARTTAEVSRGQLEALQARRAQAVAEAERAAAELAQRRAEARELVGERAEDLERLQSIDTAPAQLALDELMALLDPPRTADPVAAELADRLEVAERALIEARSHRLATAGLVEEAEARLEVARRELSEAERGVTSPQVDPAVVRRLEEVRDEIFELDERGGRLNASRSKRRIEELRAQEAELLDRMGFDTYSSYVMGIPSERVVSERVMRVDVARSEVHVLADEVERLRAGAAASSEEERIEDERRWILEAAAELMGRTPAELGAMDTAGLVGALRARRVPPPPEDAPEIVAAADRLSAALAAAGTAPGTPAGTPPGPRALAGRARNWLADTATRARALAGAEQRLEEARTELALLEQAVAAADDGGRMAELDAELHAARERLAEAEERLERHEAAMAELAELRTQELELRDRERRLLAAVAEQERVLSVLGSPAPPATGADTVAATPPPPPPDSEAEAVVAPPLVTTVTTAAGDRTPAPGDREWQALVRLSELRSVSIVGSVPLLVDGLDGAPPEGPALLHRLHRMSELVQIVVLSEDPHVLEWSASLGPDEVRVISW